MTFRTDLSRASRLLKSIIIEHATEKELDWINQQENKLSGKFQHRTFYLAFSSASRFIEKRKLNFSEKKLAEAAKVCDGFQPQYWNFLQVVRTYLLSLVPYETAEDYEASLSRLYDTADVEEQVTLYSALPLYPFPNVMVKRAEEGIRTNITDVFDSIALNNPYPANFLEQQAWNQMLLKAVFMQRPLYRIYNSDERANSELARMLIDFAHERWAANRKVLPELWRFVGPFLNSGYLTDIKKVIKGDPLEKQAGLLACADSKLPEAHQLLRRYPEINKNIENGTLNWTAIGKKDEIMRQ